MACNQSITVKIIRVSLTSSLADWKIPTVPVAENLSICKKFKRAHPSQSLDLFCHVIIYFFLLFKLPQLFTLTINMPKNDDFLGMKYYPENWSLRQIVNLSDSHLEMKQSLQSARISARKKSLASQKFRLPDDDFPWVLGVYFLPLLPSYGFMQAWLNSNFW